MRVFYKEFAKPSGMPRGLFAMSLGLIVAGLLLASIGRMHALDPTAFGVGADGTTMRPGWFGALAHGNVLPMWLDAGFWRSFPTWPRDPRALWQPESACVLLGVVAVSVFVLRCLMRRSWSLIGLAIMVSCAVPLVAAALVPRAWLDFEFGGWLWRMLALAAYGAGLCAAFGLLDMLRPQIPAARRQHRAIEHGPRRRVAVAPNATPRTAPDAPPVARARPTARSAAKRTPARKPRR